LSRLAVAAAVLAVVAIIVGLTATGGSGQTPPTATVTTSGNGSVTFTPDTATLDFGATSQRKTATAAVDANATLMNAILAAIRAAGATKVSTNSVSIGPETNQGSSTIIGFSASNSVEGSVPIDGSAKVIDAAINAGATSVNGLSFSTTGDVEAMYRQALKDAVAQARARAAALAAAAGLNVGSVVSISTDSYATATPTATAAPASVPTPVVAPTEQVSASVTVVFSIG
jgi:uncharacterized protein